MRTAPSRVLTVVAAALLLLTPAACADDRRPDLLNDLAARLDKAGDLTFTAEYRLADGGRAVIAQSQRPRRAAYLHPGGRAVSTETQLATCRDAAGGTRCTLNPPPSSSTDPVLELLALTAVPEPGAGRGAAPVGAGLVSPSTAVRLLSAAVLDGATVTRYESTVAGEAATCFGVHGPDGFTACVTERGLLATFTGNVGGSAVTFELTSFATSVSTETFALPPGATIDDRRPD